MDKALFETSCVHAVLAPDLEPSVARQVPPRTKACKYFTSLYLRMEFLRRWVVTGIEIYARADVTNDLPETLTYYSHRFRSRETKIVLQWSAHNTQSLQKDPTGEPAQRFGWLVLALALSYDKIFQNFVNPKTGCSRGRVQVDLSAPTMRKALFEFYDRFTSADHSCKLDSLLQLHRGFPKIRCFLRANPRDFPRESRRALKQLQSEIQRLVTTATVPTCNNCHKIADILVALEQPPKLTLYHVDHSFSAICPILKHKHKRLHSVLASAPPIPVITESPS